jgi:hypothetical protein
MKKYFSFLIIPVFIAACTTPAVAPTPTGTPSQTVISPSPTSNPDLQSYTFSEDLVNKVVDQKNVHSVHYTTTFKHPKTFTVTKKQCPKAEDFCYLISIQKDPLNYLEYSPLYAYVGLGGGGIIPAGSVGIPLSNGNTIARTHDPSSQNKNEYTYMGVDCADCLGVLTKDVPRKLSTGIEGTEPGLITTLYLKTSNSDPVTLAEFDAIVQSMTAKVTPL